MNAREVDGYCSPSVLVRLMQAGSRDAIDRITRCYGQRLLSAGQHHCRTHEEAKDAVQDALLHAQLHLADYRGEGSLQGWLVRIVARACYRLARGQKRSMEGHTSDAVLVSQGPSPLDLSCRGELSRSLQQALLALSPTDRLVLLLAEVDDWTAPEIAAELGLSQGAVRTRLSRVRAQLRTALAPLIAEN